MDILADFIRSQLGAGVDGSPANQQDEYEINLLLDLGNDSFRCSHDCGNKGLRDGILLRVLGNRS